MTTAGEFCNRTVVIVRGQQGLLEAAQLMREHHVGSLVVVEEHDGARTPVGVITDRDVVMRLVHDPQKRLTDLRVDDLLSGEELVEVGEDEDLVDAVKRMRAYGVRRLPVVDAHGALAGLITFDDLVEFLSEQALDLATLLGRQRRREVQKIETTDS
jgi:CBS domain-containing protein